jgi:acyl carrier protein
MDRSDGAFVDRVVRIVETVYSLAPGTVTAASTSEDIERWDSLGHLVLMLELEQEFGVQLQPDETSEMTSVRAIVNTLRDRPPA